MNVDVVQVQQQLAVDRSALLGQPGSCMLNGVSNCDYQASALRCWPPALTSCHVVLNGVVGVGDLRWAAAITRYT